MRILAAFLFVAALLFPLSTYAALPFGGLITAVGPCPTGAGTIVKVLAPPPVLSGPYAILPKTITFPYYIVKPFTFILGTYVPAANVCGAPVIGTIYMKGTSL